MNDARSKLFRLRFAVILSTVYWIALATLTHVPKLPTVRLAPGDKTAHYVAYAILAFLLSWVWTASGRAFPKGMLVVLPVTILYGAIDELTQIPVPGRYGEWYDWYADTTGAVTGTLLFWASQRLLKWSRRRRTIRT
jgi:VanZ family protein